MFGVVYGAEGTPREVLEDVARAFSPRIEIEGAGVPAASAPGGSREVTLDLSGLARLFGDARTIAEELRRTAADRGLRVRVAIAAARVAARLVVRHRAGIAVVEPGTEAAVLAPLPISLLPAVAPGDAAAMLETLRRWGLRTLGEVAALPADDVSARLGHEGVEWQRCARGEDVRPLVPALPEERFEQALDLEWPIDGLEPLSFVLGRLMEPLSAHLERRGRGAAVLHVRLHLVTRTIHERSLQLPAPMRDARALRTLALLDLESHPPDAAIDRVVVAVDPTPGRIVQFSLLTRPLPSPEQLSTLNARLAALMGEGRCGAPVTVDTWQPGAFAMAPFTPREHQRPVVIPREHDTQRQPPSPAASAPRRASSSSAGALAEADASVPQCVVDRAVTVPVLALRRFRIPAPARVRVEEGRPVRVAIDRRGFGGGRVEAAAGPWRTSGAWWLEGGAGWDRDEWDVSLSDGVTYRIFRQREADAWFVEGVVD